MYIQDQLAWDQVNDTNLAFFKAIGVDFAACSTFKWLMGDFGIGQLAAGRHLIIAVVTNRLNQQRFVRLARHQRRTTVAAGLQVTEMVDPQRPFLLFRAMALEAPLGQQRAHGRGGRASRQRARVPPGPGARHPAPALASVGRLIRLSASSRAARTARPRPRRGPRRRCGG